MREDDLDEDKQPSIMESEAVVWEDGIPRFRMEVLGNSTWAIRKAEEDERLSESP